MELEENVIAKSDDTKQQMGRAGERDRKKNRIH